MPHTVRRLVGLLAAFAAALPATALAQSVDLAVVPPGIGTRFDAAPPLGLAARAGAAPLAELRAAAEGAADELERIRAWNEAGMRPTRNGFSRPLALPRRVAFGATVADASFGPLAGGLFQRDGERLVWGAEIRVAQAFALRLHLADVDLPAGARMWVYNDEGESWGPFGLELLSEEGLWTPSVSGGVIRLELSLPADAAAGATFAVDRVLEIVDLEATLAPRLGECVRDASCFNSSHYPVIEVHRKAVAQLLFVDGGDGFICTGQLLNDADDATTIPWLLTANHCFDRQAVASTLEARFDFRSATCNGAAPGFNSVPKTVGSTLMATTENSDATLVRLSSLPSGRALLGWNGNDSAVAGGTRLSTLSHPAPGFDIEVQSLNQGHKVAVPNGCTIQNSQGQNIAGNFWSTVNDIRGGTFGGSSGGALTLDNGQVVGQLLGGCGPDPEDGCNQNNDDVWGKFSASFPLFAPFLTGEGVPTPPGGAWLTTPSIPGFRFKVRINNSVVGARVNDCIVNTLCVSGAIADQPEVFVRIPGPKGNGYLWPTIIKFTTSKVEVWIEKTSTSQLNYYELRGASPGFDELPGLFDRTGFLP